MSLVVDASALIAILRGERGCDRAEREARGGLLSTLIFSELLAKADDRGIASDLVDGLVRELGLTLVPFDEEQARAAAALRPATRGKDVSIADRVCLGLAVVRGVPVLTADHDWAELGLDVDIRLFRDRR